MEDSRLLPVHLNFLRLVRLWGGGGVYLGFSFLLDQPLPRGRRLVDLGPRWAELDAEAAGLDAQPACANEMLLQFPSGHDPLLGCALTQYGAYFATTGGVQSSAESPCHDLAPPPTPDDASGGGAAWQHPSIATLQRLHHRPAPSGPSRASNQPAKAASWYLGYDGVDTSYEADAVTAQVKTDL